MKVSVLIVTILVYLYNDTALVMQSVTLLKGTL